MPDRVYLDSSALMRWSLCIGGSPEPRDAAGYATLEALLGSDAELRLSPITLIEVTTLLNRKIRDTSGWYADYGAAQAEATIARAMELVASGRIGGRDLHPRAYAIAMMWVAEAARIGGAKLLAMDALHLAEAVRWSRELDDAQVQVATSDSDFEEFLQILPELRRHVAVLDVCAG